MMMLMKHLVVAAFLLAAPATAVVADATAGKSAKTSSTLRAATRSATKGFVQTLRFKHTLRVCNAYPAETTLHVKRGDEAITEEAIKYRGCDEFHPNLKAGDKLEFILGGSPAGAFSVNDLPNNDATLVLLVYRHDATSTAVSFESHVFANLVNSQIAVLDTYRGSAKAVPKIQDAGEARTERSEELRYDSVVAVNAGEYEVVLVDESGEAKASQDLVALNRESYVVVRVGVEAAEGEISYPQDLLVFPHSDPKALTGSAGRHTKLSLTAALATAAALLLAQ